MKMVYFVQGFSYQKEGKRKVLRGNSPIACKSAEEAQGKAERMSVGSHVGVIAAAQEYDEGSGEYGKFTLLASYGETPPVNED